MLLIASIVSLVMLPAMGDNEHDEHAGPRASGLIGLICMPAVILMVLVVVCVAISLTFLDPILQPHLAHVSEIY